MARIFISYRRQDDSGRALRIYDHLIAHFGIDKVFFDIDTIREGANWSDVLEKSLAASDVLLAVIGPRWLDVKDETGRRKLDDPGDHLRMEIAGALRRGIFVLPVLVDRAGPPTPANLPEDLVRLPSIQALELGDVGFGDRLKRLIQTIEETRRERLSSLRRAAQQGSGSSRPEQLLELWQQVLEMDPSDQEAEQEVRAAQASQQQRQGHLNSLQRDAQASIAALDFDRGFTLLEEARQLAPNEAAILDQLKRARKLHNEHRIAETQGHTARGLDLFKRGRYLDAQVAWGEALRISPGNVQLQAFVERAEQALNHSTSPVPSRDGSRHVSDAENARAFAERLIQRGRDALREHQPQKAEVLFRQAIERQPDNSEAWELLEKLARSQKTEEPPVALPSPSTAPAKTEEIQKKTSTNSPPAKREEEPREDPDVDELRQHLRRDAFDWKARQQYWRLRDSSLFILDSREKERFRTICFLLMGLAMTFACGGVLLWLGTPRWGWFLALIPWAIVVAMTSGFAVGFANVVVAGSAMAVLSAGIQYALGFWPSAAVVLLLSVSAFPAWIKILLESKDTRLHNPGPLPKRAYLLDDEEARNRYFVRSQHEDQNLAEVKADPAPADAGRQIKLGPKWERRSDSAADLQHYLIAAQQGHPVAQNSLGVMYLNGQGVARDPEAAAHWFEKGAKAGDGLAQSNLARLYEEGNGVRRNLAEALRWYKLAAANDNAVAKNAIARLTKNGRLCPQCGRSSVGGFCDHCGAQTIV